MGEIIIDSSDVERSKACNARCMPGKGILSLLAISTALVTLLSSCALIHENRDGSPVPAGDPEGADMDEYRALEYLEEHPLDPLTADPDEIRSLPGFPEHLVERLIEERERTSTARRLFEALTPPEQDALRRYEPYLDLPGRMPSRLEAWCTLDHIGPRKERRDDVRLAIRDDRYRLSARYRSKDVYRFYLAGSLPSGHVRFHVGDFTPDLAMGICFSSYTSTYPFSHGYHIRKRRWVSGTTSLYGESMRGGASELWAGPVHALLLGGRLCRYGDERLDIDGPALVCGRLALARGGFTVGAGIHSMRGDGDVPVSSFDVSWSEGRVEVAAELATDGEDWCGIWAVSTRGDRSGMSLLIYELPGGMDHPLGRSLYGAGLWRRGGSIILHRRFARHLSLFSAFERSDARNILAVKRRDLLRLECRWSAGGNSVKLSFKRRIEIRSILVPYPSSEEQPARKTEDSIHLLQAWRLPGPLRLRVSCRAPLERGASGYLVCPSLTFDRGFSMTASWALHRVLDGAPVFYCYERSLKGLYPWRALRGNGWRVALIGRMSVGPMRFALSLATSRRGPWEGAAQMGAIF